MVDIGKVPAAGDLARHVQSVSADGHGRQDRRHGQAPQQDRSRRGSEELALALSEDGGAAVEARLEQDESGATVIRVVDIESGESIAVVTPEELRDLAEQTGLPTGLLLQARS